MTMHQSSFNYIAFQLPNLQFNGPFTDAVPVQLLACGQGTLCLVVRKKVDAAGNEIDASYRVEVHCTHEKFAYSGIREVPLKGTLTADDQCIPVRLPVPALPPLHAGWELCANAGESDSTNDDDAFSRRASSKRRFHASAKRR